MSKRGGLQLLPDLKQKLDPRFLTWYHEHCTSTRMCYVHWSAGPRDVNFDDYHMVALEVGGVVNVARNAPCDQDLHAHTYQRNTDSWACCIASMYGATTEDFGHAYPTPDQQRALVLAVAEVLVNLRQPFGNIMTHAEAADNVDGAEGLEFYGPRNGCERWDWWAWVEPQTLALRACTKPKPAGWLYWPDWFRGEVAMTMQRLTRHVWELS